jgi:hypothetical protein
MIQFICLKKRGGLRDADSIVSLLKEELVKGDQVIVSRSGEGSIIYYFYHYNVDFNYYGLRNAVGAEVSGQRLFVVVKKQDSTFNKVLNSWDLSLGNGQAVMLREYPSATIYVVSGGKDKT